MINLHKHFTIRAAANAAVTITNTSGSTNGLFLITSSSPDPKQHVTFEHITFSAGLSNTDEHAGAITMVNTDVTLLNCNFQNNAASSTGPTGGGGGALLARNTNLMIVGSTFTGNHAWRSGGAIDIRGGSHLSVHDSQFLNNRVNLAEHFASSLGGAIFVLDSSLRVTNTRFKNNQAGFAGGAIYSYGDWSPTPPGIATDLLITNSTFDNNSNHCNATSCPTNFVVVAGALEAENNVTARIYNSRFLDNQAAQGGAIQIYRSQMTIHDSTFIGNQATGTASGMGYGGAIVVVSADQNHNDPVNRPSAQLTVTRTLFQGQHGATTTTGVFGGCIFTQGDYNRQYGLNGMPQNGTLQYNRAEVDISHSIFSDCDVLGGASSTGVGGGLHAGLSDLTRSNSLFLGCDALGNANGAGSGGALAVRGQTLANIDNVTIAGSKAAFNGAAIWAAGAELNLSSSQIFENQLTTPQFDGAAIYTASENIYQLSKATGLVQDTLFSHNTGASGKHVIYDWDTGTTASPTNLTQYSNNSFFPNDSSVYASHIWGSGGVAFLNSLASKAPISNIGLTSEPVVGAIMVAPSATLSTNAAGDPAAPKTAYIGVAWSGAPAVLDGSNISDHALLQANAAGTHSLLVGSQSWPANISQAPAPGSQLTLQPPVISNGFTTLAWQTYSGTFLDQILDHRVAVAQPAAANGSTSITPSASTTYHGLMIAAEGGTYTRAKLTVANDLIFYSGFEH
ncbi:MAG: hypothetical protein L0H70_00030 [Xanthomonadales bacterium]|nr:hypothetical protein [Xanthomonadales bacterium]